MAVRHFAEHRSELLEQQPENRLTLAFGPVPALGGVVEDGVGGAAVEAAPRLVIEFVGGELHRQGKIFWFSTGGLLALIQRGFEVANAFFLRAVVAGIIRRIIQRQHAEAGQDGIDLLAVEGRTVVAFEEQGRAVLAEQAFQMGGNRPAFRRLRHQGAEAIAGGAVLEGDGQATESLDCLTSRCIKPIVSVRLKSFAPLFPPGRRPALRRQLETWHVKSDT